VSTHPDAIAGETVDTSHTRTEQRLTPGVYPVRPDPHGHTLLVGDNQRALHVLDLGQAAHVGGVAVTNPDHLDALAGRLRDLAARMRAFPTATADIPA
jgi:hypothetical protein